jgi:hypothetical protein
VVGREAGEHERVESGLTTFLTDAGHLNLWAESLQSGRRGRVPWTVAQQGIWNMVVVYVHRRPGSGWPGGGWIGMMRERECRCGGWMDMRGDKGTRNPLQLKSRLVVLESHGEVWNEEVAGMGWPVLEGVIVIIITANTEI